MVKMDIYDGGRVGNYNSAESTYSGRGLYGVGTQWKSSVCRYTEQLLLLPTILFQELDTLWKQNEETQHAQEIHYVFFYRYSNFF